MEEADFLVCALASSPVGFADDLFGVCCQCTVAIRFRPHASKTIAKMCVACTAMQIKDGDEIGVTKETAAEVALFIATPKGRG